jgi:hypothetical protein
MFDIQLKDGTWITEIYTGTESHAIHLAGVHPSKVEDVKCWIIENGEWLAA